MTKTLLILGFIFTASSVQAQILTYKKSKFYSDETKISYREAKEILKADPFAYKGVTNAHTSKQFGYVFYGAAIGYAAASTAIGLTSDTDFKGGQVAAISGGLALIGVLLNIGKNKKIANYVDGYEKRKANKTSLSLTGTSQGIGLRYSF